MLWDPLKNVLMIQKKTVLNAVQKGVSPVSLLTVWLTSSMMNTTINRRINHWFCIHTQNV